MKIISGLIVTLLISTLPAWAQDQPTANDIVLKMQHDLNLSQDQVANVTQIVERYVDAKADLQKSIDDGTMNPSEIDSQKQQIKAEEDQGLSQYLRSDQLLTWNNIQAQEQKKGDGDQSEPSPDDYSNLPNNN